MRDYLTYCGMSDADIILIRDIGIESYFDRQLRAYITRHNVSIGQIYNDIHKDPYRFYVMNLEYFKMPILMLMSQIKRYIGIS